MKRAFSALVLLCSIVFAANAQYCMNPGQAPKRAIPICGSVKFVAPFPQNCSGSTFANPGAGCPANLFREEAAHWYKITATQGGTLQMTITPHDLNDDYDWAIFDVTGLDENEVYTNTNITISANWTATKGITGTSPTATDQFICMQPLGTSGFVTMPTLITGHTYLIMINTIYFTLNGYDLDLSGGTAVFADLLNPQLAFATYDPVQSMVSVKINKPMMISSSVYDGTEFVINPGNIQAIFSDPESRTGHMDTDSILLYLSQPLAPGTYTVEMLSGSDGNTILDFCQRAIPVGQSVPLVIGAPMILNPTGVNLSCNGAGNGEASVSVNGGVLPFSYSWNTTPVQTSATATNLAAGTYTVTVTDAANTVQTAQVIITEPSAMQLSETHTDVFCIGASDGTATVTVSGGQAPYTYAWPQNGGQTTASINNMSPGTYPCIVTDANNCVQTIPVTIALDNPPPQAVAGQDAHLCDGALFTLSGNAPAPGTGQWMQINGPSQLTFSNNADPSATINNIQPGVYMLRWTISRGNCSTSDEVVIVRQLPMTPDAGPDTTIRNISMYKMQAAVPSVGSWQQLSGPGIAAFDDINDPQSVINNLLEGTYVFRWVLDMGPCPAQSDDVTITVEKECLFRMPNAFSPNGDGQNDVFKPARICGVSKYEMDIYNRWGVRIYSGNDPLTGWDGTLKSQQQPVASYIWIVTYTGTDQKVYMHKGTVLLTR